MKKHNIQIITNLLEQEKKNIENSLTINDYISEPNQTKAINLRIGIDVDEYISKLENSIKLDDNNIEI